MADLSMRQMLEAGVHFGHQTRFWNPKMAPYIFGARSRIHIINLEETLPLFREALSYVEKLVADGGTIWFVGTKRSARDFIREQAQRCGMPYVDHRWLGGMMTNFRTVRQSIKRLKDLELMEDDGTMDRLGKREVLALRREKDKLERSLGGIKDVNGLPDALFVIDVGFEDIAVKEAVKLGIPVVGIVDTNNSPDGVDYPVPGNDDAMRAIRLYTESFADAVLRGKENRADLAGSPDEYVEVEGGDAAASATTAPSRSKGRSAKRSGGAKTAAESSPAAAGEAGGADPEAGAEDAQTEPATAEAEDAGSEASPGGAAAAGTSSSEEAEAEASASESTEAEASAAEESTESAAGESEAGGQQEQSGSEAGEPEESGSAESGSEADEAGAEETPSKS